MNPTAVLFLILFCLFSVEARASDTGNFTLKGAVVTSEGTMVPEFTVVVRPITNKPELVLRKHFKGGTFSITGLRRDKYQVQVYAPRFAGIKMDVHFPRGRASSHYRIVVLPRIRNEIRSPLLATYTVSAKVLEQKIPEKAQKAYMRAVELHTEGKLEDAMSAYGEAIRAYPHYIQALTDVGALYILLNRPDAALTFLRRAHRTDEGNTIVRLNMAIALMTRRDYAEAMAMLKDVLLVEPRKSIPLYYIARVHFYRKQYGEAERRIREALAEDPNMIEARVMAVNLALEQENYLAARENLENLRRLMNNGLFTSFVEDQISSLGN